MLDNGRQSGRYWRHLALFTLGTLLVGTLVLVVALSARWAYAYTHPTRHPISGTPADYGLTYESVTFSSADGLSLAGWFVSPESGTGNRAAIVLCRRNVASGSHPGPARLQCVAL